MGRSPQSRSPSLAGAGPLEGSTPRSQRLATASFKRREARGERGERREASSKLASPSACRSSSARALAYLSKPNPQTHLSKSSPSSQSHELVRCGVEVLLGKGNIALRHIGRIGLAESLPQARNRGFGRGVGVQGLQITKSLSLTPQHGISWKPQNGDLSLAFFAPRRRRHRSGSGPADSPLFWKPLCKWLDQFSEGPPFPDSKIGG